MLNVLANLQRIGFLSSILLAACTSPVPYYPVDCGEDDTVDEGEYDLSESDGAGTEQDDNDYSESDDDSSDWEDDSSDWEDGGQDNGSQAYDCTYDGYQIGAEQAFYDEQDPEHPLFVYQATNSAAFPMDVIELLSYPGEPYYGPSGPGTYSLDGSNYADCSLCVMLYLGCGESSCESLLFADEGSVTISSSVGAGEDFRAQLSNVVFKEVTIDSETYETTPVPGGVTWCVDSLPLGAVTSAL
jgi:hypothetical protein